MRGNCLPVCMQNLYPEYNVLTIVYLTSILFLQILVLALLNPE